MTNGNLAARAPSYYPPMAVTFSAVVVYISFTVWITEWRTDIRRRANELDSRANSRAIDSLLNYETVKYFNNEEYEARRYDENLRQYESAAVTTEASLGLLNIGQSFIIAIAVTLLMILAAQGVVGRTLTLGDLVLINGLLIQLYIPLNFLGMVYREIKQALTDMGRMFRLLEEHREIEDRPGAVDLPVGPLSVRFDHVDFRYEHNRQILYDVSFDVPAGRKIAVVGASGSGKSTLARLLYRFYDVEAGAVCVNGVDIRNLRQTSLRAAIGIVPQDTVLFNDTVYYNIHYGRPEATEDEVFAAAKAAHIHDFMMSLPEGYETRVGERGLKLSGGEKQRVAIARAILKNPRILIFDEATSALDSKSESAIKAELDRIARGHTTLVIAHRLSTIMNQKAADLGMQRTRFVDSSGLSSENVSTAEDLAKMVTAAYRYPTIQQYTTLTDHAVALNSGRLLAYHNTNGLVRDVHWDIDVSKTGYISEAGRCIVMQARISAKPIVIVLLDSWGRYTRIADANRVKKWLESQLARQASAG